MKSKLIAFSVLLLESVVFCRQGYYLRPYFGEIPEDAINVTSTSDIYVGVGPLILKGDLIGEIFSGETSILVAPARADVEVLYINQHIWILCGADVEGFQWVQANKSTLHSIPNKVQIGYELNEMGDELYGTIYVGRGLYNGVCRVGKVVGYDPLTTDNMLWVADASELKQIYITTFEVLVYP